MMEADFLAHCCTYMIDLYVINFSLFICQCQVACFVISSRKMLWDTVPWCQCKFNISFQVEALDLDSEPNAAITFSIGSGDRDGQFTINPNDGFISIKSQLDRETVIYY